MDDYWSSSDVYSYEKEYFYETKSQEEINKYTLSEDLSTIQRAKEILSFGDLVQRLAIYKSLPLLIQESGVEEKLMTMVAKQVESQEVQIQVEAGRSFLRMIEEKKSESFKQIEFLKDILQLTMNLLHNSNIQVVDTWIEVFQKLLTEIPFPEVQKEVLAEIYDLSSICSSTSNKYSSIRMIASSIQYLGKNISDNLLNLIKLFSQFNDFQIKKSIVSEICPKLFQFLKQSQLDCDWLPLITEIIKNNNENKEIRCYAITTLSETLIHFSSETKLDKIIPVLNYLISFDSDMDIILTVCKKLGPLIYHLENELNQRDSNQALIKYIYDSVDSKNEIIRENIIFNYPCILQLFGKKYKEKLVKLYIQALIKDEEINVRIQAVKIIPEVVKFLGAEESKALLKQHIKQMLGEKDNNEIRIELAKKLGQVLEFLFQQEVQLQKQLLHQQHQVSHSHNGNNGNQHPQSAPLSTSNNIQIFSSNNNQKGVGAIMIQEIFTEILNCIEQNTKSPCWRLVKSLLEIFQQTNSTFNFSIIQDKYAPILFKCILESNFELKKLASKNLVLLIAQQKQVPQREYLFSQINNKLYAGRSYQLRMIYLEILEECINKFSRSFFKQYNLIQSLQLYSDKVPNVRRKLATLIYKIRSCIFKEDAIHIDQFDSLIIHLLLDNDQETAKIAQQQHSNLKDIDSFQSTQGEQETDKIDEIQDFIEENEDEMSINNPQKNYRSFDTIDKNPYSISQIPSGLLSGGAIIKKKNINVKKIPSVGNTKSFSTPKNTSLTSISSNNTNKGVIKNSTIASSLIFKQNGDSKKNHRNSSNSNDTISTTTTNEKIPTAHSLLVQKPNASLTQISGQQSSGSLLLRNKQNLSPIIAGSSNNQQQNNSIQTKILSQNTDYMNSNTQRDIFSDQNETSRSVKERNSVSLNKYSSLKPIQKNINKITPFNPSTTPQQNVLSQSSQVSANIISNLSIEKRATFERKATFENNPNFQVISNNIYRIKKQIPFQPSSLPPKFALKKKPQ
ncbi:hypothetical protein ABPG72_015184 [Tetrahymena utriculariae]